MDRLPDLLDSIARTRVRKNSGSTDVGARRRLNFIEGSGITLTIADDKTDEELDITIAGGSSYTDEQAQDAVGTILTDSSRVDFTYNDAANTITADLIANTISETYLTTSVAGTGLTGGNGTALSVTGARGVPASGYAAVTADQTGISTETDLTGLTITVTTVSGRRYKLTAMVRYQQNTALGTATVRIKESTTELDRVDFTAINTGVAYYIKLELSFNPSAASHTYKLSLATSLGTADVKATATNSPYIQIEDVGAA